MPDKPLLIFDGHCGFCKVWVEYWKQLTGPSIGYAPFQEVGADFPDVPPERFGEAVQLVMPDGEVRGGAWAVFTSLTHAPGLAWLLWLYDHLPGFAPFSEVCYRVIASHRNLFYHLTRLTFGRVVAPLNYARVEWLFLRALSLIYFIAFASLIPQITGLIGSHGILPLGRFLAAAREGLGVGGYWAMPTVFWFAQGDAAVKLVCWIGVALSVVLFLGAWERASLLSLYVLYLSLSVAGQDFLSFQWDSLLLETGFLAIFLGSSKLTVLLFRWLLFRLMFLSGAVKLLSHDESWRNLTAMSFHYMTQPLPNPISWFAYQLPIAFQRASTGAVLGIELAIPFLVFGPRLWRFFAAACFTFLQTLIFLTGNYTFFNLLAVALCLFLLDDAWIPRLPSRKSMISKKAVRVAAILILTVSGSQLAEIFLDWVPPVASLVARFVSPYSVVNTYGLFAVMTTRRPEIVVQGSADGVIWRDYQFPYKPGDLTAAPRFVAPYQPRLDWQMWFAALSDPQQTAWFRDFLLRVLEGSRDVTSLLAVNPFPGAPPKYVRALRFNYSFTDFAERRATGNWWTREPRGLYFPAVSLEDLGR